MNLFVVGLRHGGGLVEARAREPLERLLRELPFFPGRPVEAWSAAGGCAVAAWVRHADELPYAEARDGSLALFSGRPFRWTGDGEADGASAATAAFFLAPSGGWLKDVDGRFAAVVYRADEEALEVVTDPVGAYPLYATEADGARWLSNSPAALRELRSGGAGGARGDRLRLESVAGLAGGGWPLDGHPIWEGIERVEPGALLRLASGGESRRGLADLDSVAGTAGSGLDVDVAARRLVAAVHALADWPGRPNVLPVTGGRDSRLVLAAALAAGLDFEAVTGGAPDDPDVQVARRLCEVAGITHSLLAPDPHGNVWTEHRRAARVVRLTAGGTASLADAAGFPLGPREGALPLWHSGQGGEIGRAYYGSGPAGPALGWPAGGRARGSGAHPPLAARRLTARLLRAFTARRPHRPDLLSPAGRDLVERQIRTWVEGRLAAGVAARDVPDAFYLERRMATWAAPTHGCVEYVRDTTSPLWSRRVVADLLAPAASERAGESYHRAVLERLAPRLLDVPFEDGGGWRVAPTAAGRARTLAAKAAREAVRRARARVARPRSDSGGGRDGAAPPAPEAGGFDAIVADVREQTLSAESHAAWQVLDRARCERLLSRPAASLDAMSRYQVWRLATLFVDE